MATIHSGTAEFVLLVFSNLFFLLPAGLAYRKSLPYEGTVYLMMTIVSGWYHVEDTTDIRSPIGYRTAQTLDFFMAFSMITRTALMVLFNASKTEPDLEIQRRNINIKLVAQTILDLLALALVLENVSTKFLVMLLAIAVLVVVLAAVVWWRDTFGEIDIPDLVAGAGLMALASLCYFLVPDGAYWIVHSLWHILSAFGISLMVEAVDKQWSLFLWIWRCLTTCTCYSNTTTTPSKPDLL